MTTRTVTVTRSGSVLDGAVTTVKLADGSVTTPKLADAAVETAQLGAASVTTPKLADSSVETAKLADAAVTRAKLGSDVTDDLDAADPTAMVVAGSDAPARVVEIADFTCDGVNDEVQLSSAFTDGAAQNRVVRLVGTFQVQANLVSSAAVFVDARQAVFQLGEAVTEGIAFRGSTGTTASLTANVAAGATTLTVANTLAVGDWFQITSSESANPARTEYKKGEIFQAFDGTTTSSVTLDRATVDSYDDATNNVTLTPLTLVALPRWLGGEFRSAAGGTSRQIGLVFEYCESPRVWRTRFVGSRFQMGLRFRSSVDVYAEDVYGEDVYDAGNTANSGITGYAVQASSCTFVTLVRPFGHRCRHVWDIGQTNRTVTRHVTVVDPVGVRCYASAHATHHADDVTVYRPRSFMCGSAIHSRSPNTRWLGVVHYGTRTGGGEVTGRGNQSTLAAIRVGEYDNAANAPKTASGSAGTGLVIEADYIDNGSVANGPAIWAHDPMVDAKIRGGVWKNFLLGFLFEATTVDSFEFGEGMTIDASAWNSGDFFSLAPHATWLGSATAYSNVVLHAPARLVGAGSAAPFKIDADVDGTSTSYAAPARITANVLTPGVLASTTTAVTVVNTLTETTLLTFNVPAKVAAGDVLRFTVVGDLLNTSLAAATYRFRLKLGGTTLLTTAALSQGSSVNRRAWRGVYEIHLRSTAQQEAAGSLAVSATQGTDTMPLVSSNAVGNATTAVDLTAARDLTFTVEMGTADATTETVMRSAVLELIR